LAIGKKTARAFTAKSGDAEHRAKSAKGREEKAGNLIQMINGIGLTLGKVGLR
jgi:hypothetical protein